MSFSFEDWSGCWELWKKLRGRKNGLFEEEVRPVTRRREKEVCLGNARMRKHPIFGPVTASPFQGLKDAHTPTHTLTHARTRWQVSACSTLYVLKSAQPKFHIPVIAFSISSCELGSQRWLRAKGKFISSQCQTRSSSVKGRSNNKPRCWLFFFNSERENCSFEKQTWIVWHFRSGKEQRGKNLLISFKGGGKNSNFSGSICGGCQPTQLLKLKCVGKSEWS